MKVPLKQLVTGHGGRIVPFAALPMPFKMAVAWYMSIDGGAWEPLGKVGLAHGKMLKGALAAAMPDYDRKYGKRRFGAVHLPAALMRRMAMECDANLRARFGTFEEYARWYADNCRIPLHGRDAPWPCILGDDPSAELLQDGWHRLHRYCRIGLDPIPCIYFP